MIIHLDREGIILDANQEWLSILGYAKKEVVGELFTKFLAKKSTQTFKKILTKLIEYSYVEETLLELKSKNKKLYSSLLNISSLHDEKGTFLHLQCQLKLLDYYRESEANLLSLLETQQTYKTFSYLESKISRLMPFVEDIDRLQEILLETLSEALNVSDIVIVHSGNIVKRAKNSHVIPSMLRKHFFDSNQIEVFEFEDDIKPFLSMDKEIGMLVSVPIAQSYMLIAFNTVKEHTKLWKNFLHMLLNLIEHKIRSIYVAQSQKRIQSELALSKQSVEKAHHDLAQFQHTLDMTMDCIFMFTPDSLKFTYVNQGALKQVGYTHDEMLNMSPYDIKPQYDEPTFRKLADRFRFGDQHSVVFETVHQHKEGKLIPVEILMQYVEYEGEEPRFVAIVRDISERKKDEKMLNEAKEAAELANLSKSTFLANMSHEIRTPLNAIVGFIDILRKDERNKEKLNYLTIIKNSSHALLGVINDILDMSKIESNKLDIESINFSIRDELETLYYLFDAPASQKKILFKHQCSERVPSFVQGDPLRIKQVISNMLSNAVKFTGEEGHILVDIDYQNEMLKVTVQDNGIGISKEALKKIFAPFSQADTSISRKYGGTGLGLNICRELVELMGGTITIESEETKGTKVFLSIAAPVGHKDETKDIDITAYRFDAHILVAEDNKTNQMLISILLDELGIKSTLVDNGEEAVAACAKGSYDLVLMDINMPVMDGLEALNAIRTDTTLCEKTRSIPVIALTANALKGDKEAFILKGMDDYIAKPIDTTKLVEVLLKFLKPLV